MIPTILVLSVLVGRWWIVPLAAIAWAVLLFGIGTIDATQAPAAAAFAAANAGIGFAARNVIGFIAGRLSTNM